MDWLSKQMERARRPEGGFTLIELLVAIVILGVLAGVVVFAVGGVTDKGSTAAAKADAATIATAEEAYYAQNGKYATEDDLVKGGFLASTSNDHGVTLFGTPGVDADFRVTCDIGKTCGGDGSLPPPGGLLRVSGGSVAGTNFLNPAVTSGGGVHPNVEYMFNGLLRWAEDGTVKPDLAASYTVSPDQKTYTFTLRPAGTRMTWHNGQPINPSDVKFTFEQALLKFHSRTAASAGPALGVTGSGSGATTPSGAIQTKTQNAALGDRDVRFNFNYAYAPLVRQLNVTEAPIIPESVYGPCSYSGGTNNIDGVGCPGNNPGTGDFPTPTMVGSGPFMLKSRNTTTSVLVLVKFTNYHVPGLPLADELNQIPVPSTGPVTNATDMLKLDQIDVASPANDRILPIVSPQTSADITTANGYTIVQPPRGSGGGNCILTEGFNLWRKGDTPAQVNAGTAQPHPIFGDPTIVPANAAAGRPNPMPRGLVVRTALFMATNRQALFNANQFGKGALATSPYHSKVFGYKATTLPGYDTARAAQWLTDAGWLDDGSAVRVSDHAYGAVGTTGAVAVGTTLSFGLVSGTGSQSTYRTQIANQWAAAPIKAQMGDNGFPTGDANGNFGAHAALRDYDMITVSYCNGDDPVIGVRRQYYAGLGTTASTQINNTAFTNTAGYRSATMDAAWDGAATGTSSAHGTIQDEAAGAMPYIWLDESLGSRAWKTARCAGFNNYNTGLYVETASCTP